MLLTELLSVLLVHIFLIPKLLNIFQWRKKRSLIFQMLSLSRVIPVSAIFLLTFFIIKYLSKNKKREQKVNLIL